MNKTHLLFTPKTEHTGILLMSLLDINIYLFLSPLVVFRTTRDRR